MSRIDTIRSELLAHRKELEQELVSVNKALAAVGESEQAKGGGDRPKRGKRKTAPPSQAAMDRTLEALEQLDGVPIRSRELAERTGLSSSLTSKAAAYLYKEGRIRGPEGPHAVGYAHGKGKIPLWASLNSSNGDKSHEDGQQQQAGEEQQALTV